MKTDRFDEIAREAAVRALTPGEIDELRGSCVDPDPVDVERATGEGMPASGSEK